MNHLMGVDLGFGNIKLYDKNGATTYASHVSVATGERFADAMGDGQSVRAAVIEFSDNRFYTWHCIARSVSTWETILSYAIH